MSFVSFIPSEHIPRPMNQNSFLQSPRLTGQPSLYHSWLFSDVKKLPVQKPVIEYECKIVELKAKSFSYCQFNLGKV